MADLDELLKTATVATHLPPIVNGTDLMAMDFPEPLWVVKDLLPVGLAILAGPPKKGKSWFALELAMAVCSGGYFLDRKAEKGRVLYCALEDSPRRLKDRLQKQGWGTNALVNLDIIFGRQFHDLYGGKDGLTAFVAMLEARDYALIVIDTIARAFSVRDWNDTAAIVPVLGPIQEAASASGKLVLCLDHHRKPGGFTSDPVADILGSTSKTGIADSILGLYREPGKPGARLAVIGRDIEEQTLELRFDAFAGCWTEAARGDGLTETQRETVRVIGEFEGGATLAELVEATGRNKGTLSRELTLLVERGFIRKDGARWKA